MGFWPHWQRLRFTSAVVAAGRHALRVDDGDDGLGANGIDVTIEMASPKVPDDDLPPGPDVDASQASPQVAEQKAEVKETDLPKDRPTESEDPDRIVTMERLEKAEGGRSKNRCRPDGGR